jgi:hypothetical protein
MKLPRYGGGNGLHLLADLIDAGIGAQAANCNDTAVGAELNQCDRMEKFRKVAVRDQTAWRDHRTGKLQAGHTSRANGKPGVQCGSTSTSPTMHELSIPVVEWDEERVAHVEDAASNTILQRK